MSLESKSSTIREEEVIEYKVKEDTRVETTEWFRIKKTAWKLILVGIFGVLSLYMLMSFFGGYFFVSFFIYFILILIVINNLYQAPGELFIECGVSSSKDKDSKGDVIGIYKIPNELLVGYESKGSNVQKLKSKTGKGISIVEEIDNKNMKIKWSWYSEESPFEFYAKKETFIELKKLVNKLMDNVMMAKVNRPILVKKFLIDTMDEMESQRDIKKFELDFLGED